MNAYIKHIATYLPKNILTNEDLSRQFPDASIETLAAKIGIKERRIADADEITSDMATLAAEKLFEENDIPRDNIDYIILTTQLPDYIMPTTACIVQNRLQLSKNIGAIDISLGCSGFVYALSMAKGLINSQQAHNVLLLNCQPMSQIMHPKDKASRIIFGDAATATLICNRESEGIGHFAFGTDGSLVNMKVQAGGLKFPYSRNPNLEETVDEYGNISSPAHYYMDGANVLETTMEIVPSIVNKLLSKTNNTIDTIDCFIFHQANAYLLKLLQKTLKIPDRKFIIDMDYVGNTVSCTIPIAFQNALQQKKIKKGDKVMLVSFGVGFSWAATIVTV